MTLIQASDDLVIEVWPSSGAGDKPLLKIRSLSQGADGETPAGLLIVWAEEIAALIEGLSTAAGVLVEYEIRGGETNGD